MKSNTRLGGREGERLISLGKAGELNRCSLEYAESKKARDADHQSASQSGRQRAFSVHGGMDGERGQVQNM